VLEGRGGRRFVLAFALCCLLSSAYGFLSGAWPFEAVEVICLVAEMLLTEGGQLATGNKAGLSVIRG
jgi:hypothetical protein